MGKIVCYNCPHCATLFETEEDYRKHILDTLIGCADTINVLHRDAKDLNIGFREVVVPFNCTRYYEAEDLSNKEEKK